MRERERERENRS